MGPQLPQGPRGPPGGPWNSPWELWGPKGAPGDPPGVLGLPAGALGAPRGKILWKKHWGEFSWSGGEPPPPPPAPPGGLRPQWPLRGPFGTRPSGVSFGHARGRALRARPPGVPGHAAGRSSYTHRHTHTCIWCKAGTHNLSYPNGDSFINRFINMRFSDL